MIKRGESETLEFKSSLSSANEIVESISAFSNKDGGRILIGVSPSGKVLGITIGKDTLEKLANKIVTNTDPRVYPRMTIEKINEKNVIVIEVKESMNKPVLAFGRPFKRVGKSTLKIGKDEYEKMILEKHKNKLNFDDRICKNATLSDVSEEKVRWLLKKAKAERNLDIDPEILMREALEKLNLIRNKKITNATILMFGKETQKFFPQSQIRCGKFSGTDVTSPFIDMKVISGTVCEQIDQAEKFILSHMKKSAWIESGKIERQEKWEYPPAAIREAVTNAIAHRDYSSTANVHISIFDDRIEVWNPGGLPAPLTVEDLKRRHKSVPRNPLVANLLFLTRYIERWGTGTNRIFELCASHGLPEPIFREEAGGFSVIFRKLPIPEDLEKLELNERQKKAIEHLKRYRRITRSTYKNLTGCSERTALNDLKDLVNRNILVMKGVGKKTHYEFR